MEYWQENQRPQDRREYDLNDHDSKLKDLPARVRKNIWSVNNNFLGIG